MASRGAGHELPAGLVPAHDVRRVVPGAEDHARTLAAVERETVHAGTVRVAVDQDADTGAAEDGCDRARVDVGDVAGRVREVLAAALAGLGREAAPRLDRQAREGGA